MDRYDFGNGFVKSPTGDCIKYVDYLAELSRTAASTAALYKDIVDLNLLNQNLRKALLDYGVHDSDCEIEGHWGGTCTCGLEKAFNLAFME